MSGVDIKWVFWDAGGPLFPDGMRETGLHEHLMRALRKKGAIFDRKLVERAEKKVVDSFSPSFIRSLLWELCRPNHRLYETLLDGLSEELTQSGLAGVLPLRPEANEVLRQISVTYRMVIIDPLSAGWIRRALRKQDMLSLFSMIGVPKRSLVQRARKDLASGTSLPIVFDGEEAAPYEKPDTRLFELAVMAVNAEPAACVLVADRLDTDIVPAKTVGIRTILFRVGDHIYQQPRFPEEAPDVIIQTLPDLPRALERLR